ncbi:MAG: hypothetical protein H6888_02205 [Nitratireductor sp.]|nr:hypothetical protein [Nitratireductor sp.]
MSVLKPIGKLDPAPHERVYESTEGTMGICKHFANPVSKLRLTRLVYSLVTPEILKKDLGETPTVYIILLPAKDGKREQVYVGESKQAATRLAPHRNDDNYQSALSFYALTSPNRILTKNDVVRLESMMMDLFAAHKGFELLSIPPRLRVSGARDFPFLLEVFNEWQELLFAAGFPKLEPPNLKARLAEKYETGKRFLYSGEGLLGKAYAFNPGRTTDYPHLTATGVDVCEGMFVVLPGSRYYLRERYTVHGTNRRQQIENLNILAPDMRNGDYKIFTQPYVFASSRAAADTLSGTYVQNKQIWRPFKPGEESGEENEESDPARELKAFLRSTHPLGDTIH